MNDNYLLPDNLWSIQIAHENARDFNLYSLRLRLRKSNKRAQKLKNKPNQQNKTKKKRIAKWNIHFERSAYRLNCLAWADNAMLFIYSTQKNAQTVWDWQDNGQNRMCCVSQALLWQYLFIDHIWSALHLCVFVYCHRIFSLQYICGSQCIIISR